MNKRTKDLNNNLTKIGSHLDYWDKVYGKAFNESFHAKFESLQYKATVALTGATRIFSIEKIYEELGL